MHNKRLIRNGDLNLIALSSRGNCGRLSVKHSSDNSQDFSILLSPLSKANSETTPYESVNCSDWQNVYREKYASLRQKPKRATVLIKNPV